MLKIILLGIAILFSLVVVQLSSAVQTLAEEAESIQLDPLEQKEIRYNADYGIYTIPYSMTNGKITKLELSECGIMLFLDHHMDSEIKITLPRALLDAREKGTYYDYDFVVLVDDEETRSIEESSTAIDRTLIIPLSTKANQIGIFVTVPADSSVYYSCASNQKNSEHLELFSPKKQIENNIVVDKVVCKNGLILFQKIADESTSCVTLDTAVSLSDRGWGKYLRHPDSQKINTGKYNEVMIHYEVLGASDIKIKPNFATSSIIIDLKTTSDGRITISIPRLVIDARLGPEGVGGEDDSFFVLVDGEEVDFVENTATRSYRELVIPFEVGNTQIEIIGTSIP